MTIANSLYGDTGQSFNPTAFRNSFSNGIGRPSLFSFRIKRYPNIYTQPQLSAAKILSNKFGGGVKHVLGVNIDKAINAGQTLYDSVTSSGLSKLQFRIDKVMTPDKILGTYTTKIYGPSSDFPREIENTSINFNVLCGGDYYEHDFFQTWIDSIVTYGTSKTTSSEKVINSLLNKISNSKNTASSRFDVAYYDDIITDAEIVLYNEEGDASYIISLEDIFPKFVGGMQLDWANKNEISIFNVNMHCRLVTGSKVNATLKTGKIIGGLNAVFAENEKNILNKIF